MLRRRCAIIAALAFVAGWYAAVRFTDHLIETDPLGTIDEHSGIG